MIDGSRFPEGSVDAAAANNFNKGVWICYFTEDGRDLRTVWSMLHTLAGGAFGSLSAWGPAFAYTGNEDGALMFFDGPSGGIIAHTGFTDRGTRVMNEVLQSSYGPQRVQGLFVTPLVHGNVEESFDGSPAKKLVEGSRVVPYADYT